MSGDYPKTFGDRGRQSIVHKKSQEPRQTGESGYAFRISLSAIRSLTIPTTVRLPRTALQSRVEEEGKTT
jgi:hypothetical protein